MNENQKEKLMGNNGEKRNRGGEQKNREKTIWEENRKGKNYK